MSYCISEMQHWGNQLVALLWLYWSPLGWQIKRNNNMVSKTFSAPWAAAESCRKREPGIFMKFISRWKHEVLHWLWTWENTVNNHHQHQQMTSRPNSSQTAETSHWTWDALDSVPLHSSYRILGPSFQNETQHLLFIWQEDFLSVTI